MHFGYARNGGPSCDSSVWPLAQMMRNEPAVRQGISLLQQHCLSGGLTVRFAGDAPPTPHFNRHIQRIFVPFCREAIQSALAVGFVPYRIRTIGDGCKVPEVLPLGTFTWSVTRDATLVPKTWFFDPRRQHIGAGASESRRKGGDGALLNYEVRSSLTEHPPLVYTFTTPSLLFPCTSALSTLLNAYDMLCHKRDCMLRADHYNSRPSLVFEEQTNFKPNEVARNGAGLECSTSAEQSDAFYARRRVMGDRQRLHYDVFADARLRSQLPEETVTLVAPVNHSVHSLEKALTPQDLHREELGFMRLVAVTLGIPPALLLQGSAVIGTAAVSTAAATLGWADSAESSNRQLIETCGELNQHLQMLLEDVYSVIYPNSPVPRFILRVLPTLCLEQLTSVFDAHLIDDEIFSSILKATWGTELGPKAIAAREEKRRAEYVMPFRDRVDKKRPKT